MFGAISHDLVVPISGYAQGAGDLRYRTELVLTNYRDQRQYIEVSQVQGGYAAVIWISPIDPLETRLHCCDSMFGSTQSQGTNIGALRFRTLTVAPGGGPGVPDPDGRIEATAFIVADRGKFANDGSSRQEIAGIPSTEYSAKEAVFLGIRHSPNTGTYTNVGIVNMDPSQTVTFYVQFQREEPVAVVVPPNSLRQIRVPGEGGGWRALRVYPEWSVTDGEPAHTTEWVAYASSIDMRTGDAFSGIRVPPTTRYDFPGAD